MEKNQLVTIINDVFAREGQPIDLDPQDFEIAAIKKMPKADVSRWKPSDTRILPSQAQEGILENAYNVVDRANHGLRNTNGQTHLTYNRESERVFSAIPFEHVFEQYALCYPCTLLEGNLNVLLNHLPEQYYSSERKQYLSHTYDQPKRIHSIDLSVKIEAQSRVMVANKTSILNSEIPSDEKVFFLENRYMIFVDDRTVILKLKNQMKYMMIFLPAPSLTPEELDLIGNDRIHYTADTINQQYYSVSALRPHGGTNILIFGAPGTGKSYYIEQNFENTIYERVVFHEEYSYHDFIGTIKPDIKEGRPTYNFDPGPFSVILKNALSNRLGMHTLIIEELNRANAASVFGDIFQLLDRDTDGVSEYSIYNEALQKYLKDEGLEVNEIRLPANLNIVATMNSADQGVFPLDTAFKRRWNYEYMPIVFGDFHDNKILYFTENNEEERMNRNITIKDYIETINFYLGSNEFLDVNEDRLVGPYYLKPAEWNSWMSKKSYRKLFAYLWDDVARIERKALFKSGIVQFSDVCSIMDQHGQVFTDELHDLLMAKTTTEVVDPNISEG